MTQPPNNLPYGHAGQQPPPFPQQPQQPPPFPQQPPRYAPPGPGEFVLGPPGGYPGPYGPAPAARLPGPSLGMHLRRAIDWNVREVVVTPRERDQLERAGVREPRLQALLSWRRSSLLVALFPLLLSVVLAFVQASSRPIDNLTDVGKLCAWLPALGLLLVPVGVIRVLVGWTEVRVTSKFLVGCWVISIAVPLLTALLPLDFLVDLGSIRGTATTMDQLNAIDGEIFFDRLLLAINYALTLLPVIISVPGGVLRGASRVKSMFPAASLPGWFLVAVAPFYSMFTVVVFVLLDQVVGNGMLLVGVALLAFSPWVFVVYRKAYIRPLSTREAMKELSKASRVGGIITIAGLFFIVVYLLSAKVQGLPLIGSNDHKAVFGYVQILRTGTEVFARGIVTSVVFCLILLSMVFSEWHTSTQMRPDVRTEHDSEMSALRRYAERTSG